MGTASQRTVERLADDHWEWLGSLLEHLPEDAYNSAFLEILYTSAFRHGYKHCLEREGKDE